MGFSSYIRFINEKKIVKNRRWQFSTLKYHLISVLFITHRKTKMKSSQLINKSVHKNLHWIFAQVKEKKNHGYWSYSITTMIIRRRVYFWSITGSSDINSSNILTNNLLVHNNRFSLGSYHIMTFLELTKIGELNAYMNVSLTVGWCDSRVHQWEQVLDLRVFSQFSSPHQ